MTGTGTIRWPQVPPEWAGWSFHAKVAWMIGHGVPRPTWHEAAAELRRRSAAARAVRKERRERAETFSRRAADDEEARRAPIVVDLRAEADGGDKAA